MLYTAAMMLFMANVIHTSSACHVDNQTQIVPDASLESCICLQEFFASAWAASGLLRLWVEQGAVLRPQYAALLA